MTIRLAAHGTVELTGTCPVEDAELLLQQLLANPGAAVDWSNCESAHAAVIQVLLVAGVIPLGTPAGLFLREKIAPLPGRNV